MVAVLGDLSLHVEDGGFVLLARGFVGFGGGFGFFEIGFGRSELVFDHGHALGKRGHFFLQTQDFLVGDLEFDEVFKVLQHEDQFILACDDGQPNGATGLPARPPRPSMSAK